MLKFETLQVEFDEEIKILKRHIETINQITENRNGILRRGKMENLTRNINIIDYLHGEIVERHKQIVETNKETSEILTRIGQNLEANSKLIKQLKNSF